MNKPLKLWLSSSALLYTFASFAITENASRLDYDLTVGEDNYLNHAAQAKFSLDLQWSLRAQINATRTDSQSSGELLGGAELKINPSHTVSLLVGGIRSNYGLRAREAKPSYVYALSSLWNGEKRTDLSLGLDLARFTDSRYDIAYAENTLRIGIDQELSLEWALGVIGSATNHSAVADRTRFRPLAGSISSSTLPGTSYGRTQNTFAVYTNFLGLHDNILSLSATSVKAIGVSERALTVAPQWTHLFGQHFEARLSATGTYQRGENTLYAGLVGVGYVF